MQTVPKPNLLTATPDDLTSFSLEAMFDQFNANRDEALKRDRELNKKITAAMLGVPVAAEGVPAVLRRIPVGIYARYSSDLQHPKSIGDQFADCRRYCGVKGYEPILFCSDEAKTGQTVVGRDGWARMMEAVREGLISIIVVESLDRAARDPGDLLMILNQLNSVGACIDTALDGVATELQVLLHGIYNSIFKAGLVQKVRRGMEGAVRRGKHAGGVLYGLKKKRDPENEENDDWYPDPKPAQHLFRIFYETAIENRPYKEVCDRLNGEGVKSPLGVLWQPQTIMRLLTNIRVLGIIHWNKYSYPLDKAKNTRRPVPNDRKDWVVGFNPNHARIPAALYIKAQEMVKSREIGPSGPRGAPAKRILSKRLKCGVCRVGTMQIVAGDKDNRPRVSCQVFKDNGPCQHGRSYYLDTIELMVVSALKKHINRPELLEVQHKEAVAEIDRVRKELIAERATVMAELKVLSSTSGNVIENLSQPGLDGETVNRLLETQVKPLQLQADAQAKRLIEIDKLLASDRVDVAKAEAKSDMLFQLENLLRANGGRNLSQDVIAAFQAVIGRVYVNPEAETRHFNLEIQGRFDALVSTDYLGPVAMISATEYKESEKAGSRRNDSLIFGKTYSICASTHAWPSFTPSDVTLRRMPRAQAIKDPAFVRSLPTKGATNKVHAETD